MTPVWLNRLQELATLNEPCVLVTVAAVRGSAPRETGAKMVVSLQDMQGSIGGGELEHRCLRLALNALRDKASSAASNFSHTFPLGPECGQCCGGVVDVVFEVLDPATSVWLPALLDFQQRGEDVLLITPTESRAGVAKVLVTAQGGVGLSGADSNLIEHARVLLASDGSLQQLTVAMGDAVGVPVVLEPVRRTNFDIVLFGAGHVGSALITILAGLDCDVRWIDSRADLFPSALPGNIQALPAADPAALVARMPEGAYYLVMTHSHPLDLELCHQVLARDDAAYCGLIGSRSKRNRFEKRLRNMLGIGFDPEKLTCPIGAAAGTGKKPMEIAVAVAAELLRLQQQRMDMSANKQKTVRPLVSAVKQ